MTISNFKYEKKKQKLRKLLNNKGWKINDFNTDAKTHNVYFCNMKTKEQFLVTVILDENFKELQTTALKHKSELGDITNYLASKSKLTKEKNSELQESASLWAITSQAFKIAEQQWTPSDFSSIVIFYTGIGDNVYIRPVCLPAKYNQPVSPEQIWDYSNQALEIDKQNHPERFSEKAPVININNN